MRTGRLGKVCGWWEWALLVYHGLIDCGEGLRKILYKWLGGDLSLGCLLRVLLSRVCRSLLAKQVRICEYPSCNGYDEGTSM